MNMISYDVVKAEHENRLRQAQHAHLVQRLLANKPNVAFRLLGKLGDLLITLRASLKAQPQQKFVQTRLDIRPGIDFDAGPQQGNKRMNYQQLLRSVLAPLLSLTVLATSAILPNVQNAHAAPLVAPSQAPIIHIVRAGDTLSAIAVTYGTSVQALINLNHLSSTTIYVGQQIIIASEQIPGSGIGTIYTVVRGDSLSALAWRFNTTVQSIMNANGLRSSVLEIGQQLAIPRDFPIPAPGPAEPSSYVVQGGDSLSSVAHRYGISVATLMAANHLMGTTIYFGQVLQIPSSPGTPTGDTSRPLACTAVNPSVNQYDDPQGHFCLIYPGRFHLADQAYRRVGIYGPPLDQSMEPVFAAVVIINEGPANGTSLEEVVNSYVQNNAEGFEVWRQAMTLGGEAAIRVDGVLGRTMSRQIFVIHAGRVYHLSFYPDDPNFPQAAPDVDELWQVVVASFNFTG